MSHFFCLYATYFINLLWQNLKRFCPGSALCNSLCILQLDQFRNKFFLMLTNIKSYVVSRLR